MRKLNNRQKEQGKGRIQKDHTSKHIHAEKEHENKPDGSQAAGAGSAPEKLEPYQAENKVGRNEPCPCGSGKKYKKCCLLKEK
jgi:preprotein translocase subunit SecA